MALDAFLAPTPVQVALVAQATVCLVAGLALLDRERSGGYVAIMLALAVVPVTACAGRRAKRALSLLILQWAVLMAVIGSSAAYAHRLPLVVFYVPIMLFSAWTFLMIAWDGRDGR